MASKHLWMTGADDVFVAETRRQAVILAREFYAARALDIVEVKEYMADLHQLNDATLVKLEEGVEKRRCGEIAGDAPVGFLVSFNA